MKPHVCLLLALPLVACSLDPKQSAPPNIPAADLTVFPSPTYLFDNLSPPTGEATAGAAAPAQPGFTARPPPAAAPEETSTIPLPRMLPEETILILSPGPGSRLTNPIHIAGVAGPGLGQSLVVRVISADGQELAIAPAAIDADLDQRGPFAVDIAITVTDVMPAFIQVYSASPVDGGILHLTAIEVTLAPRGAANIKPLVSHLERIVIDRPAAGEKIQGGNVLVQGFALASFEQTLVVEVVGPDGREIGSQSLIVNSTEPGTPGPFSVDVSYSAASGPGWIIVRDPSPAFNGDIHVATVEVEMEP